jgi:hypothetical protein
MDRAGGRKANGAKISVDPRFPQAKACTLTLFRQAKACTLTLFRQAKARKSEYSKLFRQAKARKSEYSKLFRQAKARKSEYSKLFRVQALACHSNLLCRLGSPLS